MPAVIIHVASFTLASAAIVGRTLDVLLGMLEVVFCSGDGHVEHLMRCQNAGGYVGVVKDGREVEGQ